MRHKDHRTQRGVSLCGVKIRGGQIAYSWERVTCPACLKLRVAS